jgi:hypothetical protein
MIMTWFIQAPDWTPHQWSIDLFLASIAAAAILSASMFLIALSLLIWERFFD